MALVLFKSLELVLFSKSDVCNVSFRWLSTHKRLHEISRRSSWSSLLLELVVVRLLVLLVVLLLLCVDDRTGFCMIVVIELLDEFDDAIDWAVESRDDEFCVDVDVLWLLKCTGMPDSVEYMFDSLRIIDDESVSLSESSRMFLIKCWASFEVLNGLAMRSMESVLPYMSNMAQSGCAC